MSETANAGTAHSGESILGSVASRVLRIDATSFPDPSPIYDERADGVSAFGFENLKGTRANAPLSPKGIQRSDRIAERHGFVPRDPATTQPTKIERKGKQGPSGAAGQFDLRAAVEDVNEFVEPSSQ